MSSANTGWEIPKDFAESHNRQAFLTNFPPEGRVSNIEGVHFQLSAYRPDALIALNARDHSGEFLRLWLDVPNAMYLMALLSTLQKTKNIPVPTEQPPPTKAHPLV